MPVNYDASRMALLHPESRETLFQSGQSYNTLQLAIEASRLSYLRVESSSAEAGRLAKALARVGFSAPMSFQDSTTDTQGFLARRPSDGVAILAFRGTQPDSVRDLLIDAKAFLVPWAETAGRVHQGFATAARSVWPTVRQLLADARIDRDKLLVTGHSLGAALATLVTSIVRPGYLVTLGSPRVGDGAFVATVKAGTCVRLVDCCDVVTQLPPAVVGYTHLEPYTYLDRSGAVTEQPEERSVLRDRRAARWEYLWKYAWRPPTVVLRDLADHAPVNYARGYF